MADREHALSTKDCWCQPEVESFYDEVRLVGHKLFITRAANGVVIEAVTDERPLTRMTFELTDDEWRDFAEGAGFDG